MLIQRKMQLKEDMRQQIFTMIFANRLNIIFTYLQSNFIKHDQKILSYISFSIEGNEAYCCDNKVIKSHSSPILAMLVTMERYFLTWSHGFSNG